MPSGRIRLSDAVEQYLTSRRATCAVTTVQQETFVARRFVSVVGDLYVENLRPSHVEAFFTSLLDDHVTRDGRTRPAISASSWNYLYARIKSLALYLSTRGYTRYDLMEYVRPRKVEQRKRLQPGADVMWAMLDAARDDRDRAFLATACNTGLRAKSLADLRIGDVDLDALFLRARISKSRLEDDMPITSDLAAELASWLKVYRAYQVAKLDRVPQPSDFLFPARRSPTWRWDVQPDGSRERVSVPGGWDPLRPVRKPHVIAQDALESVGFPRLHEGAHTLRRGAARLLFDSSSRSAATTGRCAWSPPSSTTATSAPLRHTWASGVSGGYATYTSKDAHFSAPGRLPVVHDPFSCALERLTSHANPCHDLPFPSDLP